MGRKRQLRVRSRAARTKYYYAFENTPNGYYKDPFGSRGRLHRFTSMEARDRFVADAPSWGDSYLGSRMALSGRDVIRDPGTHKAIYVWEASSSPDS